MNRIQDFEKKIAIGIDGLIKQKNKPNHYPKFGITFKPYSRENEKLLNYKIITTIGKLPDKLTFYDMDGNYVFKVIDEQKNPVGLACYLIIKREENK